MKKLIISHIKHKYKFLLIFFWFLGQFQLCRFITYIDIILNILNRLQINEKTNNKPYKT